MTTRTVTVTIALLASLLPACTGPAGRARVPLALDDEAIMDRIIEHATPGAGHERLAHLEGRWDQRIRFRSAPGAEPEHASMIAEYRWTMEGRFLRGEMIGDIGGAPFRAMELIGYDGFRREYISLWIDTMSTAFLTARGRFDPATMRLEMRGASDDVRDGRRDRPFRTVLDLSEPDRVACEMFAPGPDGREFLALDSTWTRSN